MTQVGLSKTIKLPCTGCSFHPKNRELCYDLLGDILLPVQSNQPLRLHEDIEKMFLNCQNILRTAYFTSSSSSVGPLLDDRLKENLKNPETLKGCPLYSLSCLSPSYRAHLLA